MDGNCEIRPEVIYINIIKNIYLIRLKKQKVHKYIKNTNNYAMAEENIGIIFT